MKKTITIFLLIIGINLLSNTININDFSEEEWIKIKKEAKEEVTFQNRESKKNIFLYALSIIVGMNFDLDEKCGLKSPKLGTNNNFTDKNSQAIYKQSKMLRKTRKNKLFKSECFQKNNDNSLANIINQEQNKLKKLKMQQEEDQKKFSNETSNNKKREGKVNNFYFNQNIKKTKIENNLNYYQERQKTKIETLKSKENYFNNLSSFLSLNTVKYIPGLIGIFYETYKIISRNKKLNDALQDVNENSEKENDLHFDYNIDLLKGNAKASLSWEG